MNNLQLPSLSELWLHYDGDPALAAADRRCLTLPPLRPRPRPATPPLPISPHYPGYSLGHRGTVNPQHPIPATLPARRDHRRGPKAKAKGKAKSGKAQGRAARGGSSPRITSQYFTSMDAELNLSSEPWRISMPLVNMRDHGK
ncbi:hypothetical protein JB92DRAFT_3115993 [Gautieria morchelliformis]|nr:hypothetical protein JB92DRAFT_3115993 [Gautieria morchelliformis]